MFNIHWLISNNRPNKSIITTTASATQLKETRQGNNPKIIEIEYFFDSCDWSFKLAKIV